MKLYVDDQRPAPVGWLCARTVDEAIQYLMQGKVTEMSLDYDLGGADTTGLDVLAWLESAVDAGRIALPAMTAHSGSILGRRRLETHIDWLTQRFAR
jgi:hypothetical protein